MIQEKELKAFIRNGYRDYLPNISIDCTIFGYHDRGLKVLLLKWKPFNGWSLPGGRVHRSESLQASAERILLERTGLDQIFLRQFHVFGDSPFRMNRADYTEVLKFWGIEISKENWLLDRTLSVGFYSLVNFHQVNPRPDAFTVECAWWDIAEVPNLMFDHNEMIHSALQTLRREIYSQPIGLNLLPEKFTLPEIHELYETILGKKLDRRNFPKKLLSLGIIKKLNERRNIGPHRAPFLYRFDKRKYAKALKEGLSFPF